MLRSSFRKITYNGARLRSTRFMSTEDGLPTSKASRLTREISFSFDGDAPKKPEDVKVVLLENIHPLAVKAFTDVGFNVTQYKEALSGQELIDVAGDAHILGIRSKTTLTKEFFESVGWHSNRLWGVGCFCIGTNQVNLSAAAAKGVCTFNAPFSNTRSVAEKTVAEAIALSRRLFERSMEMHDGVWNKSAVRSREVRGRTIGIVGYGRIGSQVSVLAEMMGFKVLFYDVLKCLPLGNAVQVDSIEELLQSSDIVTLHVPSSETTHGLMTAEMLGHMKKDAHLINNARGDVVDIDALADALKSGHLGGAAVDVFPVEPAGNGPGFETPLLKLPNVIMTPHVGGSTIEAQANIGKEVADKLIQYMLTGSSVTSVNIPNIDNQSVKPNNMRILNFHRNQPGVLSKLLNILAEMNVNVNAQKLESNPSYSYVSLDVEVRTEAARQLINQRLSSLEATLWTRTLLYDGTMI